MFRRRPLLWIAGAWICGMIVADACSAEWIAAGAAIALGVGWAAGGGGRGTAAWAALLAICFAAGGARFEWAQAQNVSALPLSGLAASEGIVNGTISSPPTLDGDRVVFDVAIRQIEFPEEGTSGVPLAAVDMRRERMKVYVRLASQAEVKPALAWKRGDRVKIAGSVERPSAATNFGGFDYRSYLERRGIFWILRASSAGSVEIAPDRPEWSLQRVMGVVDAVRKTLGERLDELFDEPTAGFMKGLLLGVLDDLDPELYRDFSQIGLTHILAISGLHVGIYVGALLWLLSRFPIARETRLLAAMLAIPAYVVLTGASPSVMRAGLMAIIALYAARRRILKDGLHILAAAAMLMLAVRPAYLFDVSFQLSFAVTAGLIALVPISNEQLGFVRSAALRSALSVTLVAQAVSFPLTVYYFNGFNLLSFPANFIFVPVYSIGVLPLGSISLVVSFLSPTAAGFVAFAADWLTRACNAAVEILSGIDFAATIWAAPAAWWICVYYGFLTAGAAIGSGRMPAFGSALRRRIAAAACAVGLAAACGYAYAPDALSRDAVVSFIDVGQGDAILIRTPSGKHLLIDGGGTIRFGKAEDEWRSRRDPFEVGEDVVVPLLKRRGVQAIDALFVSHGDADHIGGLRSVVEHIPVRRVFFNGTVKEGDANEDFYRAAARRGIPLIPVHKGMSIRVDEHASVEVLFPGSADDLRVVKEQNGSSVVLYMTLYEKSFLFTGDIAAAQERAILAALREGGDGEELLSGVDVIKIAHHGSKTSTTGEWLAHWQPSTAVIPVGRTNVYGHPHPTVVERLHRSTIRTFRTDLDGEIQFRIAPGSFRVRTMM